MTLLLRLYGVRPPVRHPVRAQHDIATPAADGVPVPAAPACPLSARATEKPGHRVRIESGADRAVKILEPLL